MKASTGAYFATDVLINAGDNVHISADTDLSLFALNDFTIGFGTSFGSSFAYHDGRGDVYFTYDQESGQGVNAGNDVTMAADQVRFNAPLVDFSSTTSLVFPIFTAAVPCTFGRFYLQEMVIGGNSIHQICYCSQNVPLNVPKCYRVFTEVG